MTLNDMGLRTGLIPKKRVLDEVRGRKFEALFEGILSIIYRVLINLYPDPTEKTIERSPFFLRRGGHWCRGDLVGRTTF